MSKRFYNERWSGVNEYKEISTQAMDGWYELAMAQFKPGVEMTAEFYSERATEVKDTTFHDADNPYGYIPSSLVQLVYFHNDENCKPVIDDIIHEFTSTEHKYTFIPKSITTEWSGLVGLFIKEPVTGKYGFRFSSNFISFGEGDPDTTLVKRPIRLEITKFPFTKDKRMSLQEQLCELSVEEDDSILDPSVYDMEAKCIFSDGSEVLIDKFSKRGIGAWWNYMRVRKLKSDISGHNVCEMSYMAKVSMANNEEYTYIEIVNYHSYFVEEVTECDFPLNMKLIPAGAIQPFQKDGETVLDREISVLKPFYLSDSLMTIRQWIGYTPNDINDSDIMQWSVNHRRPKTGRTYYDVLNMLNNMSRLQNLEPYYTLSNIVYGLPEGDTFENQEVWADESTMIKYATVTINGGYGYRLPTYNELLYAGLGGTSDNYTKYAGDDDASKTMWFGSLYYSDNFDGGGGLPLPNSGSNNYQFTSLDNMIGPKPVKQKKPNSLGLYDILGNVINYCGDVEDIDGTDTKIKVFGCDFTGDPPTPLELGRIPNEWDSTMQTSDIWNLMHTGFNAFGFRVARTSNIPTTPTSTYHDVEVRIVVLDSYIKEEIGSETKMMLSEAIDLYLSHRHKKLGLILNINSGLITFNYEYISTILNTKSAEEPGIDPIGATVPPMKDDIPDVQLDPGGGGGGS